MPEQHRQRVHLDQRGPGRLNSTKTAGPNIVGGPFIGGNFWAFPNGTGFSQTHPDTDGDGFCDEPYFLTEDTTDDLPLALPNVTPIGGDRGYFLVSTVPAGAAISLVDISGTAVPAGEHHDGRPAQRHRSCSRRRR